MHIFGVKTGQTLLGIIIELVIYTEGGHVKQLHEYTMCAVQICLDLEKQYVILLT